jgi:hypothetical protein
MFVLFVLFVFDGNLKHVFTVPYIRMYVFMYVYMYEYACIYVWIYVDLSMHVCMYYVRMYVRMYYINKNLFIHWVYSWVLITAHSFSPTCVQLACLPILYLTPKTFTKLWADQMQMNLAIHFDTEWSPGEIINIHLKKGEIKQDSFQIYCCREEFMRKRNGKY